MPLFKYKVINRDFDKESGTIEAASDKQVESILSNKGYQIISISQSSSSDGLGSFFRGLVGRVTIKQLVVFMRQFSVLISASVPLSQSLHILSEQVEQPALRAVIMEISNNVDAGERLSEAMSKHRNVFSEFHISVVRSGETSGKLDESLIYLADEEEKNYEMVRKLKGAMTYPVIILITMAGVGVAMMIFVVPKLVTIFNEVGGELPIMTRMLIGVSDLVLNYWWALLAALLGLALFIKFLTNKPFGKRYIDLALFRIPIFGNIIKKMAMVRFCRTMSTLLVGGVTISNSLKISKGIVGNSVFQDLVTETIAEVEEGNSVSTAFLRSKEIPVMMPKMMMIGEKTGKLDFVLVKIADFYAKELDAILDNLMVILEPVIMVFMGVAVLFMAMAIIMPMYNLTSQF
jgi:type IV pilus assembly protein PilC